MEKSNAQKRIERDLAPVAGVAFFADMGSLGPRRGVKRPAEEPAPRGKHAGGAGEAILERGPAKKARVSTTAPVAAAAAASAASPAQKAPSPRSKHFSPRKLRLHALLKTPVLSDVAASKWATIGAPTAVAGTRSYYDALSCTVTRSNGETASYTFRAGKDEHVRIRVNEAKDGSDIHIAVGRIMSFFRESRKNTLHAQIAWCYFPEETVTGRLPFHHPWEVMRTDHQDEVDVDSIDGPCHVLAEPEFYAAVAAKGSIHRATRHETLYLVRYFYDYLAELMRPVVVPRLLEGLDGDSSSSSSSGGGAASSSASSSSSSSSSSAASIAAADAAVAPFYAASTALSLSAAPKALPCREGLRDTIYKNLKDGLRHNSSGLILVSGMPGTGKTATVMDVLKTLVDEAHARKVPTFDVASINALSLVEPAQIYTEIWREITDILLQPKAAQAQITAMLEKRQARSDGSGSAACSDGDESDGRPIILVVDEIDYLITPTWSVLYDLWNWPTLKGCRFTVVGITNTPNLPERAPPKLASRASTVRVAFESYTKEQITRIVQTRLAGLHVFDEAAVRFVSAKIGTLSGDLRRALQLCSRAAELAAQRVRAVLQAGGQLPESQRVVTVGDITAALHSLSSDALVLRIAEATGIERLLLIGAVLRIRRTGRNEHSIEHDVHSTISLTLQTAGVRVGGGAGSGGAGEAAEAAAAASSAVDVSDKLGYMIDEVDPAFLEDLKATVAPGATEAGRDEMLRQAYNPRNMPSPAHLAFAAQKLATSGLIAVTFVPEARCHVMGLRVTTAVVVEALKDDPLAKRVLQE